MIYHVPVLSEEIIKGLDLKKNKIYIDCTLGGGGHFFKMLKDLEEGTLIGIDRDEDSIDKVSLDLLQSGFKKIYRVENMNRFSNKGLKVILIKDNFTNLEGILTSIQGLKRSESVGRSMNLKGKADGVLFDLGVSSFQIDSIPRGFSYMHDGPLDMRMDKKLSVTAMDLVNGLYEKELKKILFMYGDEAFASRIAKGIIKARREGKIESSKRLCEVIKKNVPYYYKNPYAKTFQALRIAVNNELEDLEEVLKEIDKVLNKNGRVLFISFHSLEDRTIKKYFNKNNLYREVSKIIRPEKSEIDNNKRARSAKLRIYEKIK